jgi:transposase
VDLLAERSAEALADWLREHPGVEVIARDRSGSYAEGTSQGAPDAVQVADRWHLLKNLVDALERFLNGQGTALQAADREGPPEAAVESATPALPRPPDARERERLNRRAPRLARYERVRTLAEEGHSFREIARQTGMARATVVRYLRAGEFPEIAQRVKTPSRLDPYCTYIEQRWQAGCRNGRQLYEEIRSQGYRGSYARLCAWLSPWRSRHAETPEQRARPRRSSRRVAHWLIRKADDLDKEDQQFLERLQASNVDCAIAHTLAREFATRVRERQGERLLGWIERAKAGGVAAIRRFAEGLVPDLAAVTAGLTLRWSNGSTEGAVNRLKLIKRQMYGRAGFDLLRRRVLCNA